MNINDVMAFLTEEAKRFDWSGFKEPVFGISNNDVTASGWIAGTWQFEIGRGATLDEAHASLMRKVSDRAATNRTRAAELIAEANRLEAKQ